LEIGIILFIFVPCISNKVTLKAMEKTKIFFVQPMRGVYVAIARKLGCTPKYVRMVLRDKLGKYSDRDTDLVKKIRKTAAEIENVLKLDQNTK
jgi:hypothetical protein